jgi:hypothetical protein
MAAKSKQDVTPELGSDEEARKAKMLKAGIGIGIGSAAVVAALLYANSARNKKKADKAIPNETD